MAENSKEVYGFKVGDVIWSDYFNAELLIVRIDDDLDWWFLVLPYERGHAQIHKAQTTLSYVARHPRS